MTPLQIKIAVYGGTALLLLLLARKASAQAAAVPRVSQTLTVVDDVFSPYFGMTEAEIAAAKGQATADNPAVDPEMRKLIDRSNLLIAQDNTEGNP